MERTETPRDYKNYLIWPEPEQLRETSQWKIAITIGRDTGDQLHTRSFYAGSTFPTYEEAVEHSFVFGKQIIDGKYQVSVMDL